MMPEFDRPTDLTRSTRSSVIATRGMVATSQPLAAQAGLAVLRAGGNAVDAAIATAAALNVVEPMSTGIGGDMFAIVWSARDKKLLGLNGSGRSSRHASLEHFTSKGYRQLPLYGADTVTVPGAVDGWFALHERLGKLAMDEILAAAIAYAEDGFPVSEIIATSWGAVAQVDDPDFAATYLVEEEGNRRAPTIGEIFRQPDLGKSLRRIAVDGRDAFYRGGLADKIVGCLAARGSLIDKEDLARHASIWVDPLATTFRGYEIYELPPNGHGITVLEMLNILERDDLVALGHNSAEYLHLVVEAKKFAFADRDRYVADPAFHELPTEVLISKEYGARVRAQIDPGRASKQPRSLLAHGTDTVYLATADAEGNVVSFINSLFHGFGSRVVAPGTGICLQNRGALFSLDPAHFNRIEPSKLPLHTIIPGFVIKDGAPYLAFGVMGGDFQPFGHLQVLLNHILFGMNPQEMGERARIAENDGVVTVESGVDPAVVTRLRDMGHDVRDESGNYGGYQSILVDPATGAYHGGSDNRKDGCAVGY